MVVGGFFALRSITVDEAKRETRERVEAEGRLVEAAGLTDGVLRGDRRALADSTTSSSARCSRGSVVRVKVWSADGRILYSDEPSLIGRPLRARRGGARAAAHGRRRTPSSAT